MSLKKHAQPTNQKRDQSALSRFFARERQLEAGRRDDPAYCLELVRKNGMALDHVPAGLRTPEICLAAAGLWGRYWALFPMSSRHLKCALGRCARTDGRWLCALCQAALAHFEEKMQGMSHELCGIIRKGL